MIISTAKLIGITVSLLLLSLSMFILNLSHAFSTSNYFLINYIDYVELGGFLLGFSFFLMRGKGKGIGNLLLLFFHFSNLLKAKKQWNKKAQQQQQYSNKSIKEEKVLCTQKMFTTSV